MDDDDDDASFEAPNCPQCLVRLDLAGTIEHPYWLCPVCRSAHLSYVAIG
ncbi:hypothetical protein [Mycetocola miduiensis]|nr:hypothetical protein [Mycetocola miduiensis]